MNTLRLAVKIGVIIFFTILVIALAVPIVMRAAMSPYMYVSLDDVPQADAAIVPGASVVAHKPSPILAARADIAVQLYIKHKVGKILVTGDNRYPSYDEVTPVRTYLVDAGIPARDILLDHAGIDTYASMYDTIKMFKIASATIVTQDFHLPRALYIARHLGISAYGVAAEGQGGFMSGYIREIPASLKALWDLAIQR